MKFYHYHYYYFATVFYINILNYLEFHYISSMGLVIITEYILQADMTRNIQAIIPFQLLNIFFRFNSNWCLQEFLWLTSVFNTIYAFNMAISSIGFMNWHSHNMYCMCNNQLFIEIHLNLFLQVLFKETALTVY